MKHNRKNFSYTTYRFNLYKYLKPCYEYATSRTEKSIHTEKKKIGVLEVSAKVLADNDLKSYHKLLETLLKRKVVHAELPWGDALLRRIAESFIHGEKNLVIGVLVFVGAK